MKNSEDKSIAIIFFSDRGSDVATKIQKRIMDTNSVSIFRCPPKGLFKITKDLWNDYKSIIFISSTGIAVRAIAPNIVSKLSDPAVLVIDERENYVISLLSGHYGGANALTSKIAKLLNSKPVITTATDVNDIFAFDSFANLNSLKIKNSENIKTIARVMLDKKEGKLKEDIIVHSSYEIEGTIPEYLALSSLPKSCDVLIGFKKYESNSLYLIPTNLVLGIGCRKGTSYEEIESAFIEFIKKNEIFEDAIATISSIDLKKDEEGILEFSRLRKIPFYTYSSNELKEIETPSNSNFVKQTTGVGCVCEAAAKYHSNTLGKSNLIIKKTVINHITFALSEVNIELHWN
jgi:cobalt-precorrin 5A hydrolase